MLTIDKEKCLRCGQCAAVCPTHHISMTEDGPETHKNRRCLICGHCTAVCHGHALSFDHVPLYEQQPMEPENPVFKRIMTRRSVRYFKPEAPNQEDIQWALDLSQWAPSGKNRHATKWLVIYGKEKCDALYNFVCDVCRDTGMMPALAAQRDKGNHDSVTCGCTTVFMALAADADPKAPMLVETPDTDAAVAMTTLDLILSEMGLGTCWGGYLTFFSGLLPQLKEYLQIPKGYHVACTLLCGVPDEKYTYIPWRPKANIQWL